MVELSLPLSWTSLASGAVSPLDNVVGVGAADVALGADVASDVVVELEVASELEVVAELEAEGDRSCVDGTVLVVNDEDCSTFVDLIQN